jgi:hypothetical protein
MRDYTGALRNVDLAALGPQHPQRTPLPALEIHGEEAHHPRKAHKHKSDKERQQHETRMEKGSTHYARTRADGQAWCRALRSEGPVGTRKLTRRFHGPCWSSLALSIFFSSPKIHLSDWIIVQSAQCVV